MMRILVLSNLYPPNVVGGYERLCHDVTSDLAARGHEITVLTSDYGGMLADYPGQKILREWELLTGTDIYTAFPGTPEGRAAINKRNLQTLEQVLDAVRPEVVFAWNLFFLDVSILKALEESQYRIVVMLTDNWLLVMRNPEYVSAFFRDVVHGDIPFTPPAPSRAWRGLAGRVKRRLQRLVGLVPKRRLEAIFGANFMRDFYAAGGSQFRNYRVIHNGVRHTPRDAEAAPDRTRLVRSGTLRLLFAGRLVDLKGADTVVQALTLLDPAKLNVERIILTVVGDAQDEVYMRHFTAIVSHSGRADDIEMRPAVAEEALPALFDTHDIYLFPSLYEPFSLTLIHALACGIPTIASNVGGNPEIVGDGQSGLLFKKGSAVSLADAIVRMVQDPDLRARLANHGQKVGQHFSFKRMADEMDDFLRLKTEH